MNLRQNLDVAAKYHTQQIEFVAHSGVVSSLDGSTFALTFKSSVNETLTTQPIEADLSDFNDFVLDVRNALLALPNNVIDDVKVAGTLSASSFFLTFSFTGNNVQGPQNLLSVRSIYCGDGCTPQLTGLNLAASTQTITTIQQSDFDNYECGRRGKCDYSTGVCSCFAGYTGASCNVITALV